jgi:hypothetical protein
MASTLSAVVGRLPSIDRNARCSNRASDVRALNSVEVKRFERKVSCVRFTVTGHCVGFVQGEGAGCGSGCASRSEAPANVVKAYCSQADRFPYAEAYISYIRRQIDVFKLRTIAMPLIEGLVERLTTGRVDNMPVRETMRSLEFLASIVVSSSVMPSAK